MDGKRDVLGMWVGENESSKYWLGILNGMRNRGVEDILIICVDGLKGFPEAINAIYPKTEQHTVCILQRPKSKAVYSAVDEETALYQLNIFSEKWDKKYPKISQSWRANWPNLSTYFKYPQEVRTLIYTTNSIENFNRQLRKVTKAKTIFPTDDSLLKMLYLAMMDITKKWTGRRQDWGVIHSQLEVFFVDRLPD
jgi:transposase-like protein